MNLSQTEEYALRAVLSIAAADPAPVQASRLAVDLDLPRNYLGKTLTSLVGAGVLKSSRGASGGFRLARPPRLIALGDIVRAFNTTTPRRCLLGLGVCGEQAECPAHKRWAPAALLIDRFFDATSIADLVSIVPRGSAPLSHAP